jgi:hypothetical protein
VGGGREEVCGGGWLCVRQARLTLKASSVFPSTLRVRVIHEGLIGSYSYLISQQSGLIGYRWVGL